MKTSVATTVIICGTLLIVVPYISCAIATSQVVDAMTELAKPVSLKTGLPKSLHLVCMVLGTLMIATGITGSFVKR